MAKHNIDMEFDDSDIARLLASADGEGISYMWGIDPPPPLAFCVEKGLLVRDPSSTEPYSNPTYRLTEEGEQQLAYYKNDVVDAQYTRTQLIYERDSDVQTENR